MTKRQMEGAATLFKRWYVHLIIGCLIVCPLSYKYWRCLSAHSKAAMTTPVIISVSPLVLPPVTTASKVNLTPLLAKVTNSKSFSKSNSDSLPHRRATHGDDTVTRGDGTVTLGDGTVTHGDGTATLGDGTVTQETDLVTEPIIINHISTNKLTTFSKYGDVNISTTINPSLTKRRKPQKLNKEHRKFRSRKRGKVAHQKPRSTSPSAAQNLIQTIARMYTSRSTTPEILAKFQHQSNKWSQFCNYYNYSSELPQDNFTQNELYHHLLYDDSKRIIFCYVPKAGCSNWKRMFAVLNGTEQASNLNRSKPHILKNVNKLEYLSQGEREKRLKTYFKFAFVRNPFERIVSAYRNKITVPIDYRNREHWPNDMLYHILRTYNQEKYKKWAQTNFSSPLYFPSFKNFIQYLVDVNLDLLNEHFRPFFNLCQPCAVNYNFIGNFYQLPSDAHYILDFLRIPRDYYLNRPGHITYNTSSFVPKYYNQVPSSLKLNLMHKFSHELIMYYQLFPAEHRRDIEILRLT